jgi:hypothetical protein
VHAQHVQDVARVIIVRVAQGACLLATEGDIGNRHDVIHVRLTVASLIAALAHVPDAIPIRIVGVGGTQAGAVVGLIWDGVAVVVVGTVKSGNPRRPANTTKSNKGAPVLRRQMRQSIEEDPIRYQDSSGSHATAADHLFDSR